jgi:serine/threonine-protein kinase
MDAARWERIQSVFHAAAERPESEWPGILTAAFPDDEALRAEVLAMLRADRSGAAVLDAGVAGAASGLMPEHAAEGGVLPREPFGAYRAIRFLGEGGMGVVYLGRRDDLDSVAAIKILRDASLSPARRERFASEQRTLAQLNHPAIARLYDAGTLPEGTPWIAMEYVEGVPVTDYCEHHASSIRGRLELFRSVCGAVQHAHRRAIIHRDLKPSNILVTRDGGVKLLDFGIAKQLESLDAHADQTRTAFRLMTPAYASPEQLRGEAVGTDTDVYSLGVILYELLTGRRPFDVGNRTPTEAGDLLARQTPERPSAMARAMSLLYAGSRGPTASASSWADLDVLCLTAMHADPQRRYATVDAFMRDIDHYVKGEPLEARPDAFGYRLGKFLRRNRRAVAVAATVVVAVAGLATFYTVRLAAARNEALAEAARTQRIQRFMQSLFEGDSDAGPADTLRVMTMIDRGRQEALALSEEPAIQAELYETLGGLYQTLGDLARADTLLRAARDGRLALHGGSHPDVAKSLVALGMLRVDQSEYEEAERMIREGLAMSVRTLPADHPAIGRAMTALGRVLDERGEYDEAIATLKGAVDRFTARPPRPGAAPDPDLAAALYELANTYFYAGRYDVSDSLNRIVMEMTRRLHGERHPAIADNLINLGATEQERGRYAEAEAYFRRGLDLTRGWYGNDHPKTATNLTMLGRALVFQDRLDEGDTIMREALGILERVHGGTHPHVASALNEIGTIALRRGRYDEAERSYRSMLDIYRQVFGDGNFQIGVAYSNLSTVAMRRENFREGERLAREAVSVYSSAQGAGHLNTGIARLKLGRALLRQGQFHDAGVETGAGLAIVQPQVDPSSVWIEAALSDLIDAAEGLGDGAAARRWRAIQSGDVPASPASARR